MTLEFFGDTSSMSVVDDKNAALPNYLPLRYSITRYRRLPGAPVQSGIAERSELELSLSSEGWQKSESGGLASFIAVVAGNESAGTPRRARVHREPEIKT